MNASQFDIGTDVCYITLNINLYRKTMFIIRGYLSLFLFLVNTPRLVRAILRYFTYNFFRHLSFDISC